MAKHKEELSRAGTYVLGLMSDIERARAERDLEIDPQFRADVLRIAERLQLVATPGRGNSEEERWSAVSSKLAELPQMRRRQPVDSGDGADKPLLKPVGRPDWQGPQSVPSFRAGVIALGLIAAFIVGYAAGVSSAPRGEATEAGALPAQAAK